MQNATTSRRLEEDEPVPITQVWIFQPVPITLHFFNLDPSHLSFSACAHHNSFDPQTFTVGRFYQIAGSFNGLKVLTSPAILFRDTRKRLKCVTLSTGGRCLAECTVSRWTGGARAGLGRQPNQAELPAGDQVTRTGWLGVLPSRASLHNLSIGTNCRIA